MIPKPTSLFHRARSDGIIFTMFWHSENDHFAPALIRPPPREYVFRWFVPRASRTFSRWFLPPQASHTLHLHDCNAVTWFLDLNLFKIFLYLHVILFMAFIGVLFWSFYCHVLLGVLGLIFCSFCGWLVAIGFLVAHILLTFMMVSDMIFWSFTWDVMLPLDY